MKNINYLILALLASVALAADDPVIDVSPVDQKMNQAIEKAQNSLDDFLSKKANPPKGASDFKLKVKFAATDGQHGDEHLWFMPFTTTDKGFQGVLANEPHFISSMKFGETYQFERHQISDWGYVQNGKQIGNYTVCVLINDLDEQTAQPYRDMGFDCKK